MPRKPRTAAQKLERRALAITNALFDAAGGRDLYALYAAPPAPTRFRYLTRKNATQIIARYLRAQNRTTLPRTCS